MQIQLNARLLLGEEKALCELPEGSRAEDAVQLVRNKHPELGEMKNLLISLNGKRSSLSAELADGDCLELILLMGGG